MWSFVPLPPKKQKKVLKHLTNIQENKQLNQTGNTSSLSQTTTTDAMKNDRSSNSDKNLQFQDIIHSFKLDDILIFNNKFRIAKKSYYPY